MPKKENPFPTNPYMLKNDCQNIHEKIDRALWGQDGRGGMVKDIGDIKNFMEQSGSAHKEEKQEKKEGVKAWKALVFSIIGGAIVAAINYLCKH